jgi:hypothetical protein
MRSASRGRMGSRVLRSDGGFVIGRSQSGRPDTAGPGEDSDDLGERLQQAGQMSGRRVILLGGARRPHRKVLTPGSQFAGRFDPSDSVHSHPCHPELGSFFRRCSNRCPSYRRRPRKNPNKNRTKSAPPRTFLCRPTHPDYRPSLYGTDDAEFSESTALVKSRYSCRADRLEVIQLRKDRIPSGAAQACFFVAALPRGAYYEGVMSYAKGVSLC